MTDTRTRDTLAALLQRQETERRAQVEELLAQERAEANALVSELNPRVGTALVEALDGMEAQIRRDRRADRLLAKLEVSVPSWADRAFPPPDPDDRAEGRRQMVIFVPRPWADGHQDQVALALVDVTDAVFGRGARARRDQELARAEAEEQAHQERMIADDEEQAARRR